MPKLTAFEFSKRIMVALLVLAFLTVIAATVSTLVLEDITPMNILIPSVFTEITAATGFYYKKAEKENVERIKSFKAAESGRRVAGDDTGAEGGEVS